MNIGFMLIYDKIYNYVSWRMIMSKSKIEYTPMLKVYIVKLLVRVGIFIAVLIAYILHKDILVAFMTHEFTFGISEYGISPLHVMWAIFMVMMIRHLFPRDFFTMALRKEKKDTYVEQEGYNQLDLLKFIQDMNIKSWIVLLVWLTFNAVFAFLYLLGIIHEADLLMLSVFYFLCDYICILFFCPFQTFIMKNRCCVNCRIYDWGHLMMFTPLLFIRNFFSWSLFFTALVVLIRWEIGYAKHPERFWSGSNKTLQCVNCKDKTCQLKRKINGSL